jgi:hypothetical protein
MRRERRRCHLDILDALELVHEGVEALASPLR